MDGNPPLKLRYLPAQAGPSRPSLLSASSANAKSDGLANGRTSCAQPSTTSAVQVTPKIEGEADTAATKGAISCVTYSGFTAQSDLLHGRASPGGRLAKV
jgi:hypothetical protein